MEYLSDLEFDLLNLLAKRNGNKEYWAKFILKDLSTALTVRFELGRPEVIGFKCLICNLKVFNPSFIKESNIQKVIIEHGRKHIKDSNLILFL